MKQIPNILTICRFVLIPFIFETIMQGNFLAAFIFLTLSGLTDILDGVIARKFNFITNFGKLIDPLADKCTQLSTLIALTNINIIPSWIILVIFLKEFMMVAGASFLYGKKLVVSSRWYGKLATVLFYIAIVASFIIHFFKLPYTFDTYFYYVALVSTFFSLFMYYMDFYRRGYVNKEDLNANKMEMTSKTKIKNDKKNKK